MPTDGISVMRIILNVSKMVFDSIVKCTFDKLMLSFLVMARFDINTFHILLFTRYDCLSLIDIFVNSIYYVYYADPPFTLKIVKIIT